MSCKKYQCLTGKPCHGFEEGAVCLQITMYCTAIPTKQRKGATFLNAEPFPTIKSVYSKAARFYMHSIMAMCFTQLAADDAWAGQK
jgi:hypothetical protein